MDGKSNEVNMGYNVSIKASKHMAVVEVTSEVGFEAMDLGLALTELGVRILKGEGEYVKE